MRYLIACAVIFGLVCGLHWKKQFLSRGKLLLIQKRSHSMSNQGDDPSLSYALGVDYGTSGVRACLIDRFDSSIKDIQTSSWSTESPFDSPQVWIDALNTLLKSFSSDYLQNLHNICISGTSSSVTVFNKATNCVSRSVRMYNYNVLSECSAGAQAMAIIAKYRPQDGAVNSPSSTLAKLLSWQLEKPLKVDDEFLLHQADYVANYLLLHKYEDLATTEECPVFYSDWHNTLKLGYDVKSLEYPRWLEDLLSQVGLSVRQLPKVRQPGMAFGKIHRQLAAELGISADCQIKAGTTDSIAAFLASGANEVGQAVTSLGSTIALKALSSVPVEDSARGIYSHRLGDSWLVGGASNTGCAIFRKLGFSDAELRELSEQITLADLLALPEVFKQYYPLLKQGERFPTNDPQKQPVLEPLPYRDKDETNVDRKRLLEALLYSLSNIEAEGYRALEDLGATPISEVMSAGGGSRNEVWTKLRAHMLNKAIKQAKNVDSAYGAALLAVKYN